MKKLAILVVGYNRIPGMMRLLRSLEDAHYGNDRVTLIISLDNCGNDSVKAAADAFKWSHGEKVVRLFPERQGLRKHILACGNYLNEYDALAVLEDDLVVSPGFYAYMKQAVDFYADSDEIAGISLYTHRLNVNVNLPFTPAFGSGDCYFQQMAQSWGQVWMKKQWFEFIKWYEENENEPIAAENVPEFVAGWSKNSWLKYHIKYCIAENKYFVYPYASLTTCFNDPGQHSRRENNVFQVPMMTGAERKYSFVKFGEQEIRYDAYFERQGLGKALGVPEEMLCVDLYGSKQNWANYRYVLTRKRLPYAQMKSFGLSMRPHEENVIGAIEGDEIFLYDTTQPTEGRSCEADVHQEVEYYFNITAGIKKMTSYLAEDLKQKVAKRIFKRR